MDQLIKLVNQINEVSNLQDGGYFWFSLAKDILLIATTGLCIVGILLAIKLYYKYHLHREVFSGLSVWVKASIITIMLALVVVFINRESAFKFQSCSTSIKTDMPQVVKKISQTYPKSVIIQKDSHIVAIGFAENQQAAEQLQNQVSKNQTSLTFEQGLVIFDDNDHSTQTTLLPLQGSATTFPHYDLIRIGNTRQALKKCLTRQIKIDVDNDQDEND